ncbi:uncharacterized protein ALTATR162_LOCUS7134 [Alternaria atra]|uniref:Uncharacterized protein n=1 Tax=Alternaria atra TaxID=119953 RepID=A0A8J2N1J7_9PLEO|nr:uncharacterized protein ALTATR162_LOCUS7134 [Alternaria atra]CAG5170143.1 unnamed protein product [Alternaria atra]
MTITEQLLRLKVDHNTAATEQLAIPEVTRAEGAIAQADVVQTPATPVTLVTTEHVQLLFNRIKQDAETLNEPEKRGLLSHVQMMAKATRVAIAERSLLQDHNRLLSKINGEVKARQSTKSLVLGKAMVMTYEQLKEVRAKRAATAEAAANKAKHRRKRKSAAPDGVAPEAMAGTTQSSHGPGTWKAPVAQMVAANWP